MLKRVVQYEPELFPGLIYRMHSPSVVLLIFVSGKIVLTGAKVRTCVRRPHRCLSAHAIRLIDTRGYLRGI